MDKKARIRKIFYVVAILLALYGAIAGTRDVQAFFDQGGWQAVETIDPAKVSSILTDADGNPANGFEEQIPVGGMQVFYDGDSDSFILVVIGPEAAAPLSETNR